MKIKLILFSFVAIIVFACGKDKFQTKPQLKLISISPETVPLNGSLKIVLEYTDKEGDVDDSLILVRQRLNQRGPSTPPPSPYEIVDFPDKNKGEFQVTLEYQFGLIFGLPALRVPGSNPVRNEIDTLNLKFVARDKAGNKSDTLTINNVYVIR